MTKKQASTPTPLEMLTIKKFCEEMNIDAEFIVRAVNAHEEMLLALRLLTDADDVDLPSRLKGPMDRARKAIAKAIGR